jgi:hypothetical protein
MEEHQESAERPIGITILCILGWIEALIMFLGGFALIALWGFGIPWLEGNLGGVGSLGSSGGLGDLTDIGSILGNAGQLGTVLTLIGEIIAVLGAVLVILGVVSSVFNYWLWKMQKRAWKWVMASQVFSVVIGILGALLDPTALLGLVIPVITIIYLNVKKNLFK